MSDEPNNDHSLVAAVLQHGPYGNAALRLSRRLLVHFGGLRSVLSAPADALAPIPGMMPARTAALRAVPGLARRYFAASLPAGTALCSPNDTVMFLRAKLGNLRHECFCCIFLDNRHRVLAFAELFRGTIDGTSVYPREVVKEALDVNAAAVILAHNHPSGVCEPSRADEQITHRLRSALALIDIRLLDHLIVSDGAATSLASRGLLQSPKVP
ncbi:MAG: DNA repair protein RadC [Pseudomonadota bacterium]